MATARTKKQAPRAVTEDGYSDLVKLVGTGSKDKQVFKPDTEDDRTMADIYRYDGIGKNICDCVADDGTGPGFEIVGDTDGALWRTVKKVGLRTAYRDAAKWTRGFGGALVVMRIADNRLLEEEAGTGMVVGLDVYPCTSVSVKNNDFNTDKRSPFYGSPEKFTVTLENNDTVKVHRTRCVIFRGEKVAVSGTTEVNQRARLFGDSAMVPVVLRLKRLGLSESGISDLMSEINFAWYKLQGLNEKLATPQGRALIKAKFQTIEEGKSINRAIIGDVGEEFGIFTCSLAGIPETTYRQMQLLAAAAGLPMAKIFGESSSGLSTTGEGNQKLYDQKVENWISDHVSEPVEKLVAEILNRNAGKVGDVEIAWNSPTQPTDKEYNDMLNVQSQYCERFINTGMFSPEELKIAVFKGGHTFKPSFDVDVGDEE